MIREKYLKKIRPLYDSELIKVLTGIRRSGKSTILTQIRAELLENGVNKNNIIFINFESFAYNKLLDSSELYEFVINKVINASGKVYLFFYEIQLVADFEKIINSFRVDFDSSIFITGSNANLLSGDLATLLSGRYISFEIFPFSFNEYIQKNTLPINDESLIDYIMFGGLPGISELPNDEIKLSYLNDVLNSIVYKDVISRSNSNKFDVLNAILKYIIHNSSEILSAKSIANYLTSNRIKTSSDTIYNYIELLKNAFIISECKKYDLKCKKLLDKLNKLYVKDLGLRNILINDKQIDFSKSFETLVFNHLKSLGYKIYYGRHNDLEIDFYIEKNNISSVDIKYIQVTYLLNDNDIVHREFRPFSKINDNYEKYVISMDKLDFSRDGIKHINIIDFLCNDSF